MVQVLKIEQIRTDGGTQIRAAVSEDTVADYQQARAAGDVFPPIDVFFDGADYWLAHGWHRFHVALKAGCKEARCEVHNGTREDAVWFALSANRKNGLRLNNADKQKAIEMALERWGEKSDRDIARHIGVSDHLVAKVRGHCANAQSNERTGADGRTINISNIGKRAPRPPTEGPLGPTGHTIVDAEPVEEPDEPQEAEAPADTDHFGNPIPERLSHVFGRKNELAVLAKSLSALKAAVLKACEAEDPLFACVTASHVQVSIETARTHLAGAAPYAVCPKCAGDGCAMCKDAGWLGRFLYNSVVPEDMKYAARGSDSVSGEDAD